ncbi:MAG: DoxX family protein [Deltaproteobacteria bacterium]
MWIFEPSPSSQRALAALRIVAGFLFMLAGTMKLFAFPPAAEASGPVELGSLMGIAGILETFGGLAILLGLLTRPVAFVLAGEMAVAYFKAHFPHSFWPTVNEGVPAVLYAFVFLYLAFAGAGAWSLDVLIARHRKQRVSELPPSSQHFAQAR